jgi:acetyl esterase/lipase
MVERTGVRYGPNEQHLLDHFSMPSQRPRPTLIYVHGGGWWRGRRDTQARPMLHALVTAGWHVFTPSYRLSPEATFPDHMVDVKRSIAWVRSHVEELGVSANFVAVAGGSTGGNLAALAALTGNHPEYQHEFSDADTSVQACVPLYGVHDMLRRDGSPMWPYLSTSVMKSAPEADPAAWVAASPVRIATDDRPPFFIVHGDADSLVGVDHSRRLAAALGSVGGPATELLEVRYANHGFDFFAGVRGRATAAAVVAVLQHEFERHVDG